jgi:hypothetical protein
MRSSIRGLELILIIAIIGVAASITQAQNRERFGISAKAGGVNSVVGQVTVKREGREPTLLTNSDDLTTGDVITTDSQSYVEVLLNPGSYFRVRGESEFVLEDSSLDHLRLKLVKGTAIVEATGVDDMDLNIRVATDQADFTIMRSGVYRIEVQPGFAELSVRKGRASFGPNKADVVKGGNTVTLRNGQIARAKVSNDKDEFDLWSNQRAQLLARANEKLSARTFTGYIASLRGWDSLFWGTGSGIWAFNPRAGFYTFMPFRYGWSSPYGHHYGSYCNVNPYWRGHNSGPQITGNGGSVWGGSSGGSSGGGSTSGATSSGSGSGGSFGGGSGASQSPPSSQGSGATRVHQNRQP